ncbi:MAG: M14 family metallopeptidase [Minisyncoccia bacterium]
MKLFFTKQTIITVTIVTVIIVVVAFVIFLNYKSKQIEPIVTETNSPVFSQTTIGKSVENRSIEAYTFGNGPTHIAFVGGIHGGYEWNSVLLAYKFLDYLKANPSVIPEKLTVTIIPSANPDGVYKVIGKEGRFELTDIPTGTDESIGRFNANNVDLNRNFNCKWQATSTWRAKIVSAGTEAFSEPEAKAIRDFVLQSKPKAVIFWHSQSNAVYASECESGILFETSNIMNIFAKAAGYPAIDTFNSYPVTGDAEGWLASINIPAITVELKTHETIEWEKNLAGIKALFSYFANK